MDALTRILIDKKEEECRKNVYFDRFSNSLRE
ncbi:unnamed protein product [Haemonchus placei]|uniref:Transcriptional regulator n=1 Tax=Haemonchus placei TaxID=6290 RepID=A0A0N4VXK4_HAEPC|nr:unnamed protein product [Haemonchus placei]